MSKLPLQVAIEAHSESLSELTLRRPTVEEVARHGLPYVVIGEALDFKMAVVMKYAGLLAGIPDSSIKQLDLVDLNALAWLLSSFFLTPASAKTPTA